MTNLIIRTFIKNYDKTEDGRVREQYGVLAGILGIFCNLLLFLVKLSVGLIINSVAVISDAFNNMSDMGSSVVTIIGVKLSGKRPDKEHPFGHGRMEYVASLIVAFIIMLVGFELLKSSFGKIMSPEEVSANPVLIGILAVSILVKVWMYRYNMVMGNRIKSEILKATARDSLNDVISTGVVILSTILGRFVSFPLDGIMGLLVSAMIMYAGFGIAKDMVGMLLGTPPSRELCESVCKMVMSGEDIIGVHDLIVHDYGPGRIMASVHAEVPDDVNIIKVHEVIDAIEKKAHADLGINLVIHMDPLTMNCEKTNQARDLVVAAIGEVAPSCSIHDFRMVDGEKNVNLIFDLEVPVDFDEKQTAQILDSIKKRISAENPAFNCVINVDLKQEF